MKRILIVADFPGWIFERHALELKKRLTEYKIDIAYHRQNIPRLSQDFDLIYVLDPMPMSYPPPHKTIIGMRNEFLYREHPRGPKGLYENGFPGRCVSIKDKCCIFHVVNKNLMRVFKDVVTDKPLLLAQHGIDEEIFDKNKYKRDSHEGLIVSSAGRNSGNKSFRIVAEVCDKLGIKYVIANYNRRLTKEQMPLFYNSVDVYVCMSQTEGLSNPIIEAGSMGVPVISTRCGAAEEMIKDGESGFLIERNRESLAEALEKMKDPTLRLKMGNNLYEEIMRNWTWKVKIEDFRNMFDLFFKGGF